MCVKADDSDVFLGSVIKIKSISSSFRLLTTLIPLSSKKFFKLIANKFPPPQGPSLVFVPILTFINAPKFGCKTIHSFR